MLLTLEDELYIVIKAHKFTIFEILSVANVHMLLSSVKMLTHMAESMSSHFMSVTVETLHFSV